MYCATTFYRDSRRSFEVNETNEMWRGFRKLGKEKRDRREIRLTRKLKELIEEGCIEAIQHSAYHWTVWLPGSREIAAAGFWPRTSRIRLKQTTYFGGTVKLQKLLELAVDVYIREIERTPHDVLQEESSFAPRAGQKTNKATVPQSSQGTDSQ